MNNENVNWSTFMFFKVRHYDYYIVCNLNTSKQLSQALELHIYLCRSLLQETISRFGNLVKWTVHNNNQYTFNFLEMKL